MKEYSPVVEERARKYLQQVMTDALREMPGIPRDDILFRTSQYAVRRLSIELMQARDAIIIQHKENAALRSQLADTEDRIAAVLQENVDRHGPLP